MNDEQLWAPWRLDYIKNRAVDQQRELAEAAGLPLRRGGDPSCFLCRSIAQHRDQDTLIVARGVHVFVILNRYPYNNGHLLIAPYDHFGRLDEHSPEVHAEALSTITRLVQLLERDLKAQGFNIGLNLGAVAGAGVPGHLHWHVVPRWSGDVNFMPVTAGVRVISQSLAALYEILTTAWQSSESLGAPKGAGT